MAGYYIKYANRTTLNRGVAIYILTKLNFKERPYLCTNIVEGQFESVTVLQISTVYR